METIKAFFLLNLFFLFIIGCAPVPHLVDHQYSTQKKLQSAQHWQILAKDFSKQISKAMSKQADPILRQPGFGHAQDNETNLTDSELKAEILLSNYTLSSVYIPKKDGSIFDEAFKDLLVTELVNLGYYISNTPENSLVADWNIKEVYHRTERVASRFPAPATVLSVLGSGIYKLFDSANSVGFGEVLLAGVAIDTVMNVSNFLLLDKPIPHHEIIINFSVSNNDLIIERQSGIYYVNDKDAWHYSKTDYIHYTVTD
ncbi:MAG: hypothetical protein PF690_05110 [Deltaproteobacteria bacterium]|jgi:hypothetical protein|nr:hypothetical protein [Deltaproteobacteria bacterium]